MWEGNPPHYKGKVGTKVVLGRLESLSPNCQEKPLSVDALVPVPQTDTGRWVEDTKAIERTLVKELGKLTPYLRKKGCPRLCRGMPVCVQCGVAITRPKRLFTKNTGLC